MVDFPVTAVLDGATQAGPGCRAQWYPARPAVYCPHGEARLKARPLPGRASGTGSSPPCRRKGREERKRTAACSVGGNPQIERRTHTAGCDPECSEWHHPELQGHLSPITLLSQCPSLIIFFFQSANSVITCVVYTEFRPIPCSQSSDADRGQSPMQDSSNSQGQLPPRGADAWSPTPNPWVQKAPLSWGWSRTGTMPEACMKQGTPGCLSRFLRQLF